MDNHLSWNAQSVLGPLRGDQDLPLLATQKRVGAALRALCNTCTDEVIVRGWSCRVLLVEGVLAIASELDGGTQ